MANDESKTCPALATWTEVDPRQHPFDPADVAVALRMTAPPRPDWCQGRWTNESEVWGWVCQVSDALATHFGPWAYRWHWAPDRNAQGGWVIDRIPVPAEVLAFVTHELVSWRRWLESLAEQFQQLLPQLNPAQGAGPSDLVVQWEVAIAQLMTGIVAHSTEGDDWQGPCCRVLQWFLTANGVTPHEARELIDGALDERLSTWAYLTATDIGRISERLAQAALDALGAGTLGRSDNWPDTWPRDWPSWRATNISRS